MTLRQLEIQLAVHLLAAEIYPGPKERHRADVLEERNVYKGTAGSIYFSSLSLSNPFHFYSFLLYAADNLAPKPTDVPNISRIVHIVESSEESDGGFKSRACRKQFRNFPP